MKRARLSSVTLSLVIIFLLLLPALAAAEAAPAGAAPPPIAQQLVREGDFALQLESALGLEKSADEAAAESHLGEVGIAPRNGWIADYPVTPDIVAELQKSVSDAADAGNIPLAKDEALKRLATVSAGPGLAIRPHTGEGSYQAPPEQAEEYPSPAEVSDYYYDEGPPVVTYYAPPPDYYYLYSWVPFPFWCWDFWFPGYFILHDFHRSVYYGHHVRFISNHYNDFRANRVFRVDPVARFSGRTYAGIGASTRSGYNRSNFISTGVPGSARRIFNGPRTWGGPGGRSFSASPRAATGGSRSFHGGRAASPSYSGGRSGGPSFHGGRAAPGYSGGRSMAPSRSVTPSFGGGRGGGSFSHGGGGSGHSSRGGSQGGGRR